ncbi:MAG: hypothetical protein CVV21_01830 [Candidatus Goldiibacteriota bacterium HGW-Goldbacteria-1]|jgi:uncharacterized protein YcfL|nr:MAG: hypothetical protein CVV21_01830 [Candidatus Goldiibacteriota bacterium HGW-Goldbacteria-1]
MKKTAVLTACLFALVIFSADVFAAEAGQGADSGQEIVVKGQLKIKIQTEKPDMDIKTDINETAGKVIKTEEAFLSMAPEDIKNVKMSLPDSVYEERADYHPNFDYFEEAPIFNLALKKQNIEIEKWTFKITDLAGKTVKTLKGSGNLPEQFSWDGFDEEGYVLRMNSGYTYRLYWMDKAGNPGAVNRKEPRVVNAIKYKKDGTLILEAAEAMMFQEKRRERLTEDGKNAIEEVKDYIKMSNLYPVIIKVYSDDEAVANEQIRTLQKVIVEALKLPKNNFKFEAYKDINVPKNRRVVFRIKG